MRGKSLPVLLALSRALHGASTLEAVMDCVRSVIRERSRYLYAYVHLFHPDGRTFEIAGWVLPNAEYIRLSQKNIDVSRDPFLQRTLHISEPLVIEDLRLEPDADQAQVEATGVRTCIVLPMFEGDARMGPLVVPTFADQGVLLPTPQELELLVQIASLVGVVVGRLRANERQVAAEQQLARVARLEAMGRMAGEVAHDFNNLLQAIIANLELAESHLTESSPGPHPIVPYLTDATGAAQRAARLTKMLLASSKGQVLAREPVEVAEVLRAARSIVDKVLPMEITLRVSGEGLSAVLLGDSDQLERVFANMLLNARDAISGQGNIVVEAQCVHVNGEYVAAQRRLPSGDYAVISVSDDGAGMSAEVQARLFEPFFTTKQGERGTGLGLSVVLGVVQQHGGDVHVYSEPGLGTTFKLFLPLAPGSARSERPPALEVEKLDGSEAILVTDDDEHVRRTIDRILSGRGYQVTLAATADQAMTALGERAFDVLLSDVVLGHESGVELVERATSKQPQLRTLLMTGYSPVAMPLGIAPSLIKPFSAQTLLVTLRRALAE